MPAEGTDFANDILVGDVPDPRDDARQLERTLVTTVGFKPLVVLDIGCGEEPLGKGINEIFGDRRPISLQYISIDIDAATCPDLCWDILSFFNHLRISPPEVQSMLAPGKVDII